jgi:preprotein translocase subunit SecF
MMGLAATTTAGAADAETAVGSVFGRELLDQNPQSGVLALVGVGLLVLSVFANRRRDP